MGEKFLEEKYEEYCERLDYAPVTDSHLPRIIVAYWKAPSQAAAGPHQKENEDGISIIFLL